MALTELGDYFSRLGGSARYFGMSDSEIPLYIACRLAQSAMPSFKPEDYLHFEFVKAAAPALEKTNHHLSSLKATGHDLTKLLEEFLEYADSKLKPEHKSPAWVRFLKYYRAQQGAQADGPASGGSAA